MTFVEPLRAEEIRDPELLELIRRCEALGVPDTRFFRILARVPAFAKALLRALLLSHTEGSVDHRLKEIIRVRLARIAGDPYFGSLRSVPAMQAGLDEDRIEAGSGKWMPLSTRKASNTTRKHRSWSWTPSSLLTTECSRLRGRW